MILYDYHLPYWYTYGDQNPAVQQVAIQIFWSFFGPWIPGHLRMGVKGRAELCGDEDLGYLWLPFVDLVKDA